MKVFFDDRGELRGGWIPVAVFVGACAVMLTIMFSIPVIKWAFETWAEKWEFKPHSSEVEKTK